MLSELLKLSGIKSRSAQSADEAWGMISTQRFDLYVLDAWLPDLDGFEFCRQIRAIDSNTPIIFYSGAAYDSDRQMGIGAGANAYLVKPEVEGLIEAMSGLIAEAKKAAIKPHSTTIARLIEANRDAKFFDTSRTGQVRSVKVKPILCVRHYIC
ncbi:MAG: response regulator [Acidobacteriota bacterium]|nr:response regulator [Acidobacteriota bacterium]